MRNMPKGSNIPHGFTKQLNDAFCAAAADRDKIKAFKNIAKQHPAEAAAAVSHGIPLLMRDARERAYESYGVDTAGQKWKEQFKQQHRTLVEATQLLMWANFYLALSWHKTKLDAYAADKSLSKQEREAKVCQTGIEALEATEAVLLHYLYELTAWAESTGGSDEVVKFARHAQAMRLAGHVATRTSLTINKRLAKALDAIREHNKPANRARFEALLRELYVLAPGVWDRHHSTDWQLQATRNAVVKKIEENGKPVPQVLELARFANREALMKRARQAGLPPKEQELFRLVFGDPDRFLRNGKLNHSEAARELGVAVGTTKSLWSKIKRTLAV
jgi:hypothetical protein